MLPKSVDNLCYIESENEADGYEANSIFAIDTEPFKIQLCSFVSTEDESIKTTYGCVEKHVDKKSSPDSFDDSSIPDFEDWSEGSNLSCGVHILDVGNRHLERKIDDNQYPSYFSII